MLSQVAVLATLAGQGMCFALLILCAARCLYTSNETGFGVLYVAWGYHRLRQCDTSVC